MPARLRMRERVTACRFATANVSACQANSRWRIYPALRTRCGCDSKPAVCLFQMQAFVGIDLFHIAIFLSQRVPSEFRSIRV